MKSRADTQSLIDKAKGGDREAFGRLFERCSVRIESLIRHELGVRLRRTVDVEDILSWTFLRAADSIRQFRGGSEGALVGWLRTIARHVIHDQARQGKLREAAALVESLEAGDPSPSGAVCGRERFDRLRNALDTLSDDHRRAVLLARIRGLPIQEVARRMGKTYEATSQLLYRAGLKLREAFGSETDTFDLPPECSLEESADT